MLYDSKIIDKDKGEYGSLRDQNLFEAGEKLITALFGLRPEVAYDNKQFYANNSIKIILPTKKNIDLKYLLGILNSNLIAFYYEVMFASTHVRGGYIQFYPKDFLSLPIRISVEYEKPLVKLVDKMIHLNEQLNTSIPGNHVKEGIVKELENTDLDINSLIYKIYKLTPEEIAIVDEKKRVFK